MMQNELITKKEMAAIGEEIGYELGTKMVTDYQVANSTDVQWYAIGRNIIDQILAQPGCAGIKFFNAYNEMGEKTLVYIGLDANGKAILEYSVVTETGTLENEKGIVADRIKTGSGGRSREVGTQLDADDWGWTID